MVNKEILKMDKSILKQVAIDILNKYGLDFTGDKLNELNRALLISAKEDGNKSSIEISNLFLNNELTEEPLDILLKNLTIGETYFFRDEKLFSTLNDPRFSDFIKNKKHIRIWSAGCASGEEPYSLAILFDKLFRSNPDITFKIYASDINKHSIEKAKKGLYREWSFRSTPNWVIDEYFSRPGDNLYQIKDEIINKVKFEITNLSETEKIKNDQARFDIIICRNVLIYFNKPLVKKLMDTFYSKLYDDGIYITTASESINLNNDKFQKFFDSNNTIFSKRIIKAAPIKEKLIAKNKIIKNDIHAIKTLPNKRLLNSNASTSKIDINIAYTNAVSEYEKGNYKNSLQLFNEVKSGIGTEKYKFEIGELYFYLTINFLKLGNFENAFNVCNESLNMENLDYRLHYANGILLHENGKFAEAEAAFNKSIYLNNNFPLSYYELANLQMSLGKNNYKRNFKKVIKLLLDLEPDETIKYSDGLSAKYLLKKIAIFAD